MKNIHRLAITITLTILAFSVALAAAPKAPDREYPCEVLRVIDGDTLEVRLDLGLNVTLTDPARLYGVDCPELPTDQGKAAKAFAERWVSERDGFMLRAKGKGRDKFGRLLGTITSDGESLNAALLESGHAKRY